MESVRRTPAQILSSKLQQAWRLVALRHLSGLVRLHLVTEYPRSGGTWLSQLLSTYLCIPFPRNEMPALKESVFHGHYRPARGFNRLRQIYWLVRDGRDVLVSLYHHYLIWNEKNIKHPADVLYHRKKLEFERYEDVRTNLPDFMEFIFTHTPSRLVKFTHPGDWATFNRAWLEQAAINEERIVRLRYEDLLGDTPGELARILAQTLGGPPDAARVAEVAERYSFKTQTGRTPGQESTESFMRKGVAGDWKNHFSPEAARVFDRHAGDVLIQLGYESDHSWVANLTNA